ncbi:ABC transporter permease [Actinomadura sp. NAK00032]|uniref:ABC transporter permease n=1 Tax=Actinomadura sp. NAK00032 TaxID=2742128 RepID=UPI001592453A|nr:ABC transporter permease [Actinomadura sp. NAK00032]QKW37070.1 ABC transporter permease [Actinomadura sp. NAK00032]
MHSIRDRWADFRASPYLPAAVLLLILTVAAGLFAGSYCYAMANPAPRHIPVAVVGQGQSTAFLQTLDGHLDASLAVQKYPSYSEAAAAIEEQRAFAIIVLNGPQAALDTAAASGASVARILTQAAPAAGQAAGVPVTVRDIKPLQPTDPQGLAIFYISLAAVIIGFVGAIQFNVHAAALTPAARIAFTAAYAALGGLAICTVVDHGLGVLHLPFRESWSISALTMLTSGMVFTMFNALIGRWAMIPTWGLMVLIGNPSSGGAVSWPLLPSPLGTIGRWLPPGASVDAQHTAIYFHDHQRAQPFITLAAWTLTCTAIYLIWHHRTQRATTPQDALEFPTSEHRGD